MSDSATLEIISRASLEAFVEQYNQYPLLKDLLRKNYSDLRLLHVQLTLDTSTETTLTETTVPTNLCLSTGTALQVYLRSDNAADTSKDIDVIGQKADGTFGKFTLTTDDTDGTDPVDCGEWNVIMCVIKNDDYAGNAILDDDGLSGTIYYTCHHGVSDNSLTLSGLTDYNMYLLDIHTTLLALQANTSAFLIDFDPFVKEQIQMSLKFDEIGGYKHCFSVISDLTQVELKTAFVGTMHDLVIDLYLIIQK